MNSLTNPVTSTVSFWLFPSEPETALWQPLIDTLADHYNTPRFTPHITIAVSSDQRPVFADKQRLTKLLEQVAKQMPPLTLEVGPIRTGENFFKCVFALMQTAPVTEIADALKTQLKKMCPDAMIDATDCAHLSLIYSNIKTTQRDMLASQIIAPSPTVVFDRLGVVLPGKGETDFSNPERWELQTQVLLGSGKQVF